jgi:ABC-type lipoprotein export system ATPase subunit/ABC-type antimicrobial peptide transport system permease subunit
MIKLSRLDKTFNKNKPSEVHVLNQISLSFEEKGLVVLLGPSGSGKTTLLNVIGGLDKTDSGSISYDDKTLNKYQSKALDEIRNLKIGTIFQNYYLLPHETLYENIALTLKMIGITEKQRLDERITDLLKAVKMENYKHRKASQLSGGQQQRVAIARALAKDPDIIIADEPTGNLDSRNTLSIMQMIRSIAHHKLVIMVTHEEHLAYQFGDRVIKMKDGRIIEDGPNTPVDAFNLTLDDEIYLKDLKAAQTFTDTHTRYQLYFDESLKEPLDLSVVVKNNTVYIKVPSFIQQKVVVVDAASDLQFKDAHAKDATQTVEKDAGSLDIDPLAPVQKRRRRHVLSIKETLRMTFLKLKSLSRAGRLIYVGLGLSGAVVALATALLGSILIIRPADSKIQPPQTVFINRSDVTTFDDFKTLYNVPGFRGLSLTGPVNTSVQLIPVYQSIGMESINVSWFDIDLFSGTLVHGRMPQSKDEIIIDRFVAEALMQSNLLNALEIDRLDSFLEMSIPHPSLGSLAIVGISDGFARGIFANRNVAIDYVIAQTSFQANLSVEGLYPDIVLIEGRRPFSDDEIIISDVEFAALNVASLATARINYQNLNYQVVGIYQADATTLNPQLMSELGIHRLFYHRLGSDDRIYLYSPDEAAAIAALSQNGMLAQGVFRHQVQALRSENLSAFSGLLIFTLIALVASALSFYFIIRSSMIARIYEIGVYRSLGITKWDIQKLFVVESIVLTSISSLLGFVFLSYVLNQIANASINLINVIQITPLTIGFGILFIYFINVVSGLFPVTVLLQKTPAMINSQYDI